ncbi:MAG: response regulator [Gemmatimonadales bacterium]|jgi:CheY-like chemotaxis protein
MATAKTVLIVDDDPDFRAAVAAVLESAGYAVVQAASRRDGLEKLIEHEPHAVVLDITVESRCEGYGVNEAIKFGEEYRKYRDIPVIMVSAIQESPDERFPRSEEVESIRPDHYLTKPLDSAQLLGVLRDCLRQHAKTG